MQRSGYRTRSRAPGASRGPPPACPGAPEPKPGRSRWREAPPPSSSASRRVMRPRRGTGSWCPRATCRVTFAETSSAPRLGTKSASSFPRAHLILSRSLDTYAVPLLPRTKSKLSRAAEVTVLSPASTASSGTPRRSPASTASSGAPEPRPPPRARRFRRPVMRATDRPVLGFFAHNSPSRRQSWFERQATAPLPRGRRGPSPSSGPRGSQVQWGTTTAVTRQTAVDVENPRRGAVCVELCPPRIGLPRS